jgi:cysteinyl-tRNA synthetase
MLHIYNTLTRTKEPFTPHDPSHVRMYVCGLTVYDYCHVGHARMFVVFDVAQRWLRQRFERVTYVRNITDIDDKIIKRAVERNITIGSLTDEFIAAMHEDARALEIDPPDEEPRATQYVPQMLGLIGKLQDRGLAYQAAGGDVNFAVRQFPGYGKLSGKSLDELRAGERVAPADGKRDPLDFVLWKSAKAEEPEQAKWSSPYGVGRPGWHIECSAMATSLLGEKIDLHGGGMDLQFPHHENEIAQSEGAHPHAVPFSRTWMHNGFVRVDNEKMSKSLGNFFTIREVIEQFDPQVLRMFIVRAHYRSPLNYSDTHLEDARVALLRLYTALSAGTLAIHFDGGEFEKRFAEAMDDDFNTPVALAVLFDLATEINRSHSAQAAALLRRLAATLGLLQHDAAQAVQTGLIGKGRVPQGGNDARAIDALVEERKLAKASRDFAKADLIRKELLAKGIVLEDSAQGTTWRRQ